MIRYTEKGQDSRKKRLEDLRKRVSKIKNLSTYKESLEWKELKSLIQDFIDNEKNAERLAVIACAAGGYFSVSENGIKTVSDSRLVSDVRVAYECQERLKLIIDLIDKSDEQVEHIENTIKKIEETYHEAKEMLS